MTAHVSPAVLGTTSMFLAAFLLAGCGSATIGGSKGVSAANDDLREEVARLEAENRDLRSSLAEANAKLSEERRVREGAVSADVLRALPRCAGIDIDGLTGIIPADAAQPARQVSVYIEPFDGRHRFIQAVGTLRVEVIELAPAAATTPPVVLASTVLTPEQVREAYRSSLTGTHYTVELPLSAEQVATIRSAKLLVRVQYDDAITGQSHEATRSLDPVTPRR